MEPPEGFTPASSSSMDDALFLELQRLNITTKVAKILGVAGTLKVSFEILPVRPAS